MEKLSKKELLEECSKNKIIKCKSKTKSELIELLYNLQKNNISSQILSNTINVVTESTENNQTLRFIDLFCGIGGFHQALKNIGGTCVFASDIDTYCRKTYETNYGIKPEGDITKVDITTIPEFDILCGGFPCQPFSKAGFQKGFNDDRGNLFFNICNIVKHHKPKYIILENVRNLASHDNGNTWSVIKSQIKDLGYFTYDIPLVLNVLHFNVPQNRERVVILCKRCDLGEMPILPKIPKNPKENLTVFIKDIIDETDNNNELSGKLNTVYSVWNDFVKILYENEINIPKFPIWTDWWDNTFDVNDEFYIKYKTWIDNNRKFYNENIKILKDWLLLSRKNRDWIGAVRKFEWQSGDLVEENNNLDKCLWSSRGSGIRVKKCDYIPTLVAMAMIPIYGPKKRKLNPIELLKLQSFNENFKYDEKKIYKQLGNSVNVKMIERCARFLILNENLF